jgi:hypothetical protein
MGEYLLELGDMIKTHEEDCLIATDVSFPVHSDQIIKPVRTGHQVKIPTNPVVRYSRSIARWIRLASSEFG